MSFPYETIGRMTVVVIVAALSLFTAWVMLVLTDAIFKGVMTKLINILWRGYDIHGEHPPVWRRELSIWLHCAKNYDFSEYREKRREMRKREYRYEKD